MFSFSLSHFLIWLFLVWPTLAHCRVVTWVFQCYSHVLIRGVGLLWTSLHKKYIDSIQRPPGCSRPVQVMLMELLKNLKKLSMGSSGSESCCLSWYKILWLYVASGVVEATVVPPEEPQQDCSCRDFERKGYDEGSKTWDSFWLRIQSDSLTCTILLRWWSNSLPLVLSQESGLNSPLQMLKSISLINR